MLRSLAAVASAVLLSLAPWATVAAHATVTSATFTGSTLTVDADSGNDRIALRHDGGGTIQVLDHGVPVPITGGPATLTNTDAIMVNTGDGDDDVIVNESNGLFVPGLTVEGTGVSEIEITVNFANGADVLRVRGQDGPADAMDGSASLINIDGDDDNSDVSAFYSSFGDDRWILQGQGGNDLIVGVVDSGGGNCSGTGITFTMTGGAGNDLLTGGFLSDVIGGGPGLDLVEGGLPSCESFDSGDVLYGGEGTDTILGQGGNDVIHGGHDPDAIEGGIGNDFIRGGTGGDAITGGDGSDVLRGGFGDDTLHGTDGSPGNDSLNGKGGTDTCDADTGDVITNCESVSTSASRRAPATTSRTTGRMVVGGMPGSAPVFRFVAP